MRKKLRSTLSVLAAAAVAGIMMTAAAGPASATVKPDAITPYCSYTSSEPELSYGSTGVAVQQAQCELNSVINGATDIAQDGVFGSQTQQRTEIFQQCAGLAVDGIIGPQTWSAMDSWSDSARYC